MCAIIAMILLVISGVFGYTMASSTLTAPSVEQIQEVTPTIVSPDVLSCGAASPEQDRSDMLAFIDASLFHEGDWTEQITSDETKTTAFWQSNSMGAVAFMQWLHYDCGVTDADMSSYYTPEGFEDLLSNYESHQQTAVCANNDLRLFEFEASVNQQDYLLFYWVKQVSPTRVMNFSLTFPVSQRAKLAEYAGQLFPDLFTCEAAAG